MKATRGEQHRLLCYPPHLFAELLIKSGADTSGVPSIKARLTCPDCKRLVARYNL
jgi:hypothetical protein